MSEVRQRKSATPSELTSPATATDGTRISSVMTNKVLTFTTTRDSLNPSAKTDTNVKGKSFVQVQPVGVDAPVGALFKDREMSWTDKGTWTMFAFYTALPVFMMIGVQYIYETTGRRFGALCLQFFILFGGSQFIYHGFMDGPLKDANGNYLPNSTVIFRGCLCGVIGIANAVLLPAVHHNTLVYLALGSASCGFAMGIYLAFGIWFLMPIPYLVVISGLYHSAWFMTIWVMMAAPVFAGFAKTIVAVLYTELFNHMTKNQVSRAPQFFQGMMMAGMTQCNQTIAFYRVMTGNDTKMKVAMFVMDMFAAISTETLLSDYLREKMGKKRNKDRAITTLFVGSFYWAVKTRLLFATGLLILFGRNRLNGGPLWKSLCAKGLDIVFLLCVQRLLNELAICIVKAYLKPRMTFDDKEEGPPTESSARPSAVWQHEMGQDETLDIQAALREHRLFYGVSLQRMGQYHPSLVYALEMSSALTLPIMMRFALFDSLHLPPIMTDI